MMSGIAAREEKRSLAAFAITPGGLAVARRIKKRFGGLKIYSPLEIKKSGIVKLAGRAFKRYDGLVFICATGIAVRAIAPYLKAKHLDPAVVVVDDKTRFAISLVSGHLGGANDLALSVAALLGAKAIITTATDNAGLPCIEAIAKKFSLGIDNVKEIKRVNAAILNGGPVVIVDANKKRLDEIRRAFGNKGIFSFKARLTDKGIKDAGAIVVISSSVHAGAPKQALSKIMFLRPKELVVGIGCKRHASATAIKSAVKSAFDAAALSILGIRNVATIDIKADEPGLGRFAADIGVPIEYFKAEALKAKKAPSGPSAFVLKATGSPAVAEPAALLSAKAKRLWIKKRKSGNVTIATAKVSSR